jgi:taurine dioxygenase
MANLSDADFARIEQAFTDHSVLFFRDQPRLAPDTQIAFAKRFGELHYHPAAPRPEDQPELFVIHAHKDSKFADGNGWHSDVSCDSEPPLGSCLQLHVLPPVGGDTLFASMYAAFETLSPIMQKFLSGLTATHESEHLYRGRYTERGVDDTGKVYPSAEHPIVRTHPQSGRQALYVNPSFTARINGLSPAESKALLDFLYGHQQRPEFQVRFRWTENAIALWDNRCTQHFALWDYWPNERKGHRVTIKGERPFYRPGAPVHSELRISQRHD